MKIIEGIGEPKLSPTFFLDFFILFSAFSSLLALLRVGIDLFISDFYKIRKLKEAGADEEEIVCVLVENRIEAKEE